MSVRKLRLGTMGICLDKNHLDVVQRGIETITGDGHHIFIISDNTPGKEKIIESHASTNGVAEQPLDKYKNTVVLLVEPTFTTEDQEKDIVLRAASKIGCKYDFRNILGKILKWSKLDTAEKFICSELVAYAWYLIRKFMGKEPKAVSPNDILRDVVYSNILKWNRFFLADYYAGNVK